MSFLERWADMIGSDEAKRRECLLCTAAFLVEDFGDDAARDQVIAVGEKISAMLVAESVHPPISLLALEFVAMAYRGCVAARVAEHLRLRGVKPT